MPVLGYGSDEFPSFYSRSQRATPRRCASTPPTRSPRVMRAKWDARASRGGLVVANPIPEADEIPRDEIDAIIDQALADMDALGIPARTRRRTCSAGSSRSPAAPA